MRRWLRVVVPLAASLALLELLALVAGTLLFGTGFVAASRDQRALVRHEHAWVEDAAEAGAPRRAPLAVPSSLDFYALHPYLGFVADPASTTGPVRDSHGALETTELGFFRRRREPAPAAERPLRVAVFGGSVAFLFSLTVDDHLAALLRADGPGRERGVVVESFALPGHKQPQQLFALEYLLLLGERFDLVLNVDGFNEVALPLTENLPQGTAAVYPRSWAHLAQTTLPPTVLESAARLAALRGMRRTAAAALSAPVLGRSATAALVWRLADGALASRAAAAEASLARVSAGEAGYAVQGPPPAASGRDAVLDELVEIWRRSSRMMQQVCAANGIAYVHVLQPNQYVPGAKTLGSWERRVAYREDHPYRTAVEAGYPRLQAAGAALRDDGVDFVDATQVFAGVRKPIYVDDCCHFNGQGSRILAEHIAPAVRAALARVAPPD